MAFCAYCGKQLPEGAAVCPFCGKSATVPSTTAPPVSAPAPATTAGLSDNVAGMLAYVTIFPAILFLVLEPYNRNRYIRFHSFQSIFFAIAWVVVWIGLSILAALPGLHLLLWPLWPLVGLAFFILWLLLLLKAYQGQMWKLPLIGDMAEKQATG